jgi:hypothetical protein
MPRIDPTAHAAIRRIERAEAAAWRAARFEIRRGRPCICDASGQPMEFADAFRAAARNAVPIRTNGGLP